MRLWTVQDEAHWLEAQRLGVLTAGVTGNHLYEDEKPSYEWMREQMRLRLPTFTGDFPVWAWTEDPSDFCFSSSFGPKGSKLVLLEIEVPEERVLVSHYMAWSMYVYVSRDYLAYTEEEDDARLDFYGIGSSGDPLFQATWPRIFELEAMNKYTECTRRQACVDRVLLSEIVSVLRYTIEKSLEEELEEEDNGIV